MANLRPKATDLGKAAEDFALAWLQRQGLKPVARNWRWRGGEIDLILRDGNTLVFTEVRCRNSDRFGSAAASVDRRKQQRLLRGATLFLTRHGSDAPVRFDVLALTPQERGFAVEWIRNAFEAD